MSLDRVMIYRKTGRALTDGCIHCGKSKTYCDGINAMTKGEDRACCMACYESERDPH